MNQTDHYLEKKVIGLMKDELGGKLMQIAKKTNK